MNSRVVTERIQNVILDARGLLVSETDGRRIKRIREGLLFLSSAATMFEWLAESEQVPKRKPKRGVLDHAPRAI